MFLFVHFLPQVLLTNYYLETYWVYVTTLMTGVTAKRASPTQAQHYSLLTTQTKCEAFYSRQGGSMVEEGCQKAWGGCEPHYPYNV